MKRLSIITVCLNEREGIKKTCESILSQTWQDFEWIVIDGGSTDGTLDILSEYPVTHLVSEPDEGVYQAMNKGINLARGKYVFFLNGGDYFYRPDVLSEVFEKRNWDEDILYGEISINGSSSHVSKSLKSIKSPFAFIGHNIPHQGAFIKRSLFLSYGFYDETLKVSSDWKQWIVFALNKCSFRYLPFAVAGFDSKGISSVRMDLLQRERTDVLNTFFTVQEMNHKGFKNVRWIKLFGILPVLKIRSSRNRSQTLLFGVLPLFSIETRI